MVFINDIDPVLASIGPLSVRWYGVFFALSIAAIYLLTRWTFKREKYNISHLDSVSIYLIFGLVIGARLGHVFFYNASYFLKNPVEIFQVWEGGLSSHGATIGVFVAYLLWSKIHKVKFSKYPDVLILGFPLVAAFVRLGNFFNSELVGNYTNGEWGVVFKRLGEETPRHPVQLYAVLMNLLIFIVLFIVYKKYYKRTPPLFFMFLYMLMYFIGRFIVEFWKDLHILPEDFPLSMGQVLSILPIMIAAFYFTFVFPKQKARG